MLQAHSPTLIMLSGHRNTEACRLATNYDHKTYNTLVVMTYTPWLELICHRPMADIEALWWGSARYEGRTGAMADGIGAMADPVPIVATTTIKHD